MPSTEENHAHSQQQAKGSNSKQRNENFVPVYIFKCWFINIFRTNTWVQHLIISATLDCKCEQRQKKILKQRQD